MAVVAGLAIAMPIVSAAQAAPPPPPLAHPNVALSVEHVVPKLEIANLQPTVRATTSQHAAPADEVVQQDKPKKSFWRGGWRNIFFGVIGGLITELIVKVVTAVTVVHTAGPALPVIVICLCA